MRYLTTIPLKLKTPDGILDLQPGDTFRPDSPDAVKSLLAEGKLKPFCYWLKSVVDDCQMPCSEGEGMKCPHFKTYWKERLLKQLPSETREKTGSREVMSQKYSELAEWLHQFDLERDELKEALPGLYQDLQNAIEKLDEAFLNEGMPAFQDALDRVRSLYVEALLRCGRRVAYRIYSNILQAYLWVTADDKDRETIRASQGVSEALYTSDEIKKLKGLSKDSLREIHKVKEIFENSKIKESRCRTGKV